MMREENPTEVRCLVEVGIGALVDELRAADVEVCINFVEILARLIVLFNAGNGGDGLLVTLNPDDRLG